MIWNESPMLSIADADALQVQRAGERRRADDVELIEAVELRLAQPDLETARRRLLETRGQRRPAVRVADRHAAFVADGDVEDGCFMEVDHGAFLDDDRSRPVEERAVGDLAELGQRENGIRSEGHLGLPSEDDDAREPRLAAVDVHTTVGRRLDAVDRRSARPCVDLDQRRWVGRKLPDVVDGDGGPLVAGWSDRRRRWRP